MKEEKKTIWEQDLDPFHEGQAHARRNALAEPHAGVLFGDAFIEFESWAWKKVQQDLLQEHAIEMDLRVRAKLSAFRDGYLTSLAANRN